MCDYHTRAAELVMRDLVDALIQENLFARAERGRRCPPVALASHGLRPAEQWYRLNLNNGWLCFRVQPAMALQPRRFSRGPVWYGRTETATPQPLTAADLLGLLLAGTGTATLPGAQPAVADVRTAMEHTALTLRARDQLAVEPCYGGLLAGERLAATRGRPFHPTARATSGWSAADLERYGPMRAKPLAVDWVAVRRDRLRLGSGPASPRLHEQLLDDTAEHRLVTEMRRAGANLDEFQPIPVHPWQFEHVLPREFAEEFAAGEVVPVARGLGDFHPTASLRTLTTAPETACHVKLPLGVATLGAQRLLPPRYLDNAERAERTMRWLVDRDAELARRVLISDEGTWSGWQASASEEFADRPGHLAAQIRTYPPGVLDDPQRLVLPMSALAAHEWDVLGESLARDGSGSPDPVEFFGELAEAFCRVGLGFARYGVIPELHGQNVLVELDRGRVRRFVLRDHDTLRCYPDWMAAAGVPDPAYRIAPGASQSLRLSHARDLLGYLQTLGFQVNLYGIADALARRYGVAETVFWSQLRDSVTDVLQDLPGHVAEVAEEAILRSPTWPCRAVLGPLLRRGRSGGVSMPAGTGQVPNPLLPHIAEMSR
jgi:siderophore synthetase component